MPLALTFDQLGIERGGEPSIVLTLSSGPSEMPFVPLRLPQRARLQISGFSRMLTRAGLRGTLSLSAGTHDVSLGPEIPRVRLAIDPCTEAKLTCDVAARRREAVLERLQFRFSPAINVIGPLAFCGKAVERVAPTLLRDIYARLPRSAALMLRLAEETIDAGLTLALTTLDFERDTQGYSVRLGGAFCLLGKKTIPLPELRLPAALAGHLVPAVVPVDVGFDQILQRMKLARGTVVLPEQIVQDATTTSWASFVPPPIEVRDCASDGTRRRARLCCDSELTLEGPTRFLHNGRRWQLDGQGLRLAGPGTEAALTFSLHVQNIVGGESGRSRASYTIDVQLEPGSTLPATRIEVDQAHPLLTGGSSAVLDLRDGEGHLGITICGTGRDVSVAPLRPAERPRGPGPKACSTSIRATLGPESVAVNTWSRGRLETRLKGGVRTTWAPTSDETTQLRVAFAGTTVHRLQHRVTSVAELGLSDGAVDGSASSQVDLSCNVHLLKADPGINVLALDLTGSRCGLILSGARIELDGRAITLQDSSEVGIVVHSGGCCVDGVHPLEAEVQWKLSGPCLLYANRGGDSNRRAARRSKPVSLLTPALRSGHITLTLNENGRLAFRGAEGELYGARYFNALLNPAADLRQWYRILISDDAFGRVKGAVEAFSEQLADRLLDLRTLLLAAREIYRRENIRKPADLVPCPAMARWLSLLLVGTPRLQQELALVVRSVTEGRGLPLSLLKQLLDREMGDLGCDYEINALLNLANIGLRPGEAVGVAEREEEKPLVLQPTLRDVLAVLPTAEEIYALALAKDSDVAQTRRLADVAPELALDQLGYLLRQPEVSRWDAATLRRLRQVYEVKRKVKQLARGFGGIEHAAQPFAVGLLIGEALGAATDDSDRFSVRRSSVLGPAEVAALLQSGLASLHHGRRAQLNNRMLLELIRRRESSFTRHVLVELGGRSPRAMSGILYALLEQDQDELESPIDVVVLLQDKLGVDVPRQRDFLAGGPRARQSYFEHLSNLADFVADGADAYLARRQHLQQVCHPVAPAIAARGPETDEVHCARDAVLRADRLGQQWLRRPTTKLEKLATDAYHEAFAACARLLNDDARAFQQDWFRSFWGRNEEALRILSVVRNAAGDVDRVRNWLHVRAGIDRFDDEQRVLEAAVRSLYAYHLDQACVSRDPLVRLLVDPPAGHYNFTIISCMGFITGGRQGAELELTYRRLAQARGVQTIRSDTGIGRSLEYNARRIVEAIETCTTPWGLLGYSQGCANALLAESMLRSGAPDEQRLLGGLICRNLLFSAANGSAHGTSGMMKFTRAAVAMERFLKHYQATHSREATREVLRGVRALLDSSLLIGLLGGAHSITFERARALHRDGQWLGHVPTSTTRAVVAPNRLPEVLEFTFHMLRELSGGAAQDTQVVLGDTVGAATRVSNEYTRELASCDIGSFPQATHHWAPLAAEIDLVTTERDRRQAIYDSPTDQLVVPWVEVNARFGRIELKD